MVDAANIKKRRKRKTEMTNPLRAQPPEKLTHDIVATARALGVEFAKRAADADANDRFVTDNYQELKQAGPVARRCANWRR
jgi:hypothetical protein